MPSIVIMGLVSIEVSHRNRKIGKKDHLFVIPEFIVYPKPQVYYPGFGLARSRVRAPPGGLSLHAPQGGTVHRHRTDQSHRPQRLDANRLIRTPDSGFC